MPRPVFPHRGLVTKLARNSLPERYIPRARIAVLPPEPLRYKLADALLLNDLVPREKLNFLTQSLEVACVMESLACFQAVPRGFLTHV
jgi:hypothetical protein